MFKYTQCRIVSAERRIPGDGGWTIVLACGNTGNGVAHMDFSSAEWHFCSTCSEVGS